MLPYLRADEATPQGCAPPGAFLGLRSEHSRGHLVRAAVDARVGHRVAREAERSEVDGTVNR